MATHDLPADLYPELTITVDVDATTCREVTYSVRLDPGLLGTLLPDFQYSVQVLVEDEHGNATQRTLRLSSKGQTAEDVVALPLPREAAEVDRGRRFRLAVDPLHPFTEPERANHYLEVVGSCTSLH